MTKIPKSEYSKQSVYTTIADRLSKVKIPNIDRYIMTMQKVGKSTLDGIDFVPQNADGSLGITDLLKAVGATRASNGMRAFAGGSADKDNFNFTLSLLATKGIGYREIYYLSESPRSAAEPPVADRTIGWQHFGERSFANPKEDTSSLHLDLADDKCNIHIDQKGFVFAGPDGKIYLNADSAQHAADELLLKTYIYKIPVIGHVARFVDLSIKIQMQNTSLANANESTGFVYRPLAFSRDVVGTLAAQRLIRVGKNVRIIGRGSIGYNHFGNNEFSWAATGAIEARF